MKYKLTFNRAEAAAYINKTISALNTMATRQKHLLPYTRTGNKTSYTKAVLDNYLYRDCNPI